MDTSLHYLTMANHLLIQKRILEKVKESGLTLGQPKVLDYLKSHDGASQKEIAAVRNLVYRDFQLIGQFFR